MFLTYTVDGSLTGSTFLDDNLATGMKIIMHISLSIISFSTYTKGKKMIKCKKYIFQDYNHCIIYSEMLKWPRSLLSIGCG